MGELEVSTGGEPTLTPDDERDLEADPDPDPVSHINTSSTLLQLFTTAETCRYCTKNTTDNSDRVTPSVCSTEANLVGLRLLLMNLSRRAMTLTTLLSTSFALGASMISTAFAKSSGSNLINRHIVGHNTALFLSPEPVHCSITNNILPTTLDKLAVVSLLTILVDLPEYISLNAAASRIIQVRIHLRSGVAKIQFHVVQYSQWEVFININILITNTIVLQQTL